MAPFKLKFRMGSSRSASQEVDADPQANQSLLHNSTQGIGASCSTIDSTDCTSLGSISNDKSHLLPNGSNGERIGYLNPGILQCGESPVPHSPPPSYEHVLEENRLANLENSSMSNPPSEGCPPSRMQRLSQHTSIEQISNTCTDPDCEITNDSQDDRGSHKESIDSTEYLISTMTTPSSHENHQECTGSCDPLYGSSSQEDVLCDGHRQHCSGNMECSDRQQQHQQQNNYQDKQGSHHYQDEQQYDLSEDDGNYSDSEWNNATQNNMQQQELTSEIISNKSSKKLYKAVAKQWGITCKMSDQCRCMECQGHYFDCEFDDNDNQKTDGGLGAGTPMFISEVMHGTACTIL